MPLVQSITYQSKICLDDFDPSYDAGLSKREAEQLTEKLGAEMGDLLDLLYAAGMHSLLIVLQGRDTSGKDGTIRHLLQFSNAQSTRVAPFKVPTPVELSHDFLWRVHQVVPGKGGVTIFNRSHYEDVLVVRVHELASEKIWRKRYDQINEFELLLAEANTVILKFCLLISKEEQEERLLDREKEVEKAWKLSVGDWKERDFWDNYTRAYEDVIEKCSSEDAPWYLVPSNKKWFRNLVITEAIVERLRGLKEDWVEKLGDIGAKAKAELAEYRKGGA